MKLPPNLAVAPRPRLVKMRCACRRCGAHTITNVGFVIAGPCSLCGSYELRPLEPVPGRQAVGEAATR